MATLARRAQPCNCMVVWIETTGRVTSQAECVACLVGNRDAWLRMANYALYMLTVVVFASPSNHNCGLGTLRQGMTRQAGGLRRQRRNFVMALAAVRCSRAVAIRAGADVVMVRSVDRRMAFRAGGNSTAVMHTSRRERSLSG